MSGNIPDLRHLKVHRYRFSVFALDRMIDISPNANKGQLVLAMSGHVIEKTELVGIYDPS